MSRLLALWLPDVLRWIAAVHITELVMTPIGGTTIILMIADKSIFGGLN